MSEVDEVNDGGSAFPWGDNGNRFGAMTLRDYFAAKVLPSVYTEYVMDARIKGWDENWKLGVALDAYAMADAMLRARDAK